jgi:hypothetical protein
MLAEAAEDLGIVVLAEERLLMVEVQVEKVYQMVLMEHKIEAEEAAEAVKIELVDWEVLV